MLFRFVLLRRNFLIHYFSSANSAVSEFAFIIWLFTDNLP